MKLSEYQRLAARTINTDLSTEQLLLHGILGLNSEGGEVAGIRQKVYQGHDFDCE